MIYNFVHGGETHLHGDHDIAVVNDLHAGEFHRHEQSCRSYGSQSYLLAQKQDQIDLLFMRKFSIKDDLIFKGHLVHKDILVDLVKENFPDLVSILVLSHWVEQILVPSVEGVELFSHSNLAVFSDFKLGSIINDL